MEEPSLLDYLIEKLRFHKPSKQEVLDEDGQAIEAQVESETELQPVSSEVLVKAPLNLPWRSLLALGLALIAQSQLEPPIQNSTFGIILYVFSALFLIYALLKNEWQIPARQDTVETQIGLHVRPVPMYVFIVLLFVSFLSFRENRFSLFNVSVWILTLAAGLVTFWERDQLVNWSVVKERITSLFKGNQLSIKVDLWKVLVLAVFLLCAWFHLYQLNSIPVNMTSDHTEKILDVNGILNGEYQIFFSNNGGREPIQFYLAAFFASVLHTGLGFITLKLPMELAFLLSLIYVYRLGKEVGTRWTGLFFIALLGSSSWLNIISRVGLRLVLAPVFIAPVLFYLFRGLRLSRRNDFILAGILTGLGLLGYSAFRIVPLVIVLAVLIFACYQKFNRTSRNTWWALGLLALFAVVMALPLLSFAVEFPELIGFRTLTRMTSAERQISGSVAQIFFSNLWNALTMTFWKDGSTWFISVPNRPALDVVTAALYFMSLILMVYRWLRARRWQDLFLLISIPILMLPSILALAFPEENPSLSRAGGAAIPIFLICAIGLETLLTSLWKKTANRFARSCVVALGLALFAFSAMQNYDIALKQYPDQYARATWNTTQMGEVAKEFIQLTGNEDNVWVMAVPYWVDTRLVAYSAGYVGKDYEIWPDELETTMEQSGAKLFIVKYDDVEGMARLHEVYPDGFTAYHTSEIEGRDFYAYIVPAGE